MHILDLKKMAKHKEMRNYMNTVRQPWNFDALTDS